MVLAMTDDEKKEPEKKPETPEEPEPEKREADDAVADLKHGINLLFRAAKSAAQGAAHKARDAAQSDKVEAAFKSGASDLQKAFDRLQSDKLEGALKTSLQEIGRAFGNVAQTLEKELRGDTRHRDDDEKKS